MRAICSLTSGHFYLALLSYLPWAFCGERQILLGKIYTVDPENPWADAVAIDEDGVLVSIGSADDVLAAFGDGSNVTVLDLGDQLILPGFHDVHLHAVEAGINAQLCYVDDFTYPEDIPSYLEGISFDCKFADQGWIVAAGIDISFLFDAVDEGSEYPLDVLDSSFPDTPVLILDNLGHGAVANSRAFSIVGYDVLTSDPPGGRVLIDEDGYFLGIVLENAQQKLRDAAFPPTTANQELAYRSLLDALRKLNRNGITSVSDAGGFWRQAQTESWARALEEDTLTVRASNALYIYPDETIDEQLPELKKRFRNDPDSLLRFNQAKIYVDGILSLTTAALYEPYDISSPYLDTYDWETWEKEPSIGFEYFSNGTTLNQVARTLTNAGFQLHMHVTGDRGAGRALDAIEAIGQTDIGPPRLTHCYLVDENDRDRFAALGAIADFQLASSSFDSEYRTLLKHLIGDTRESELLPALELYEAGALLTISSDWDADTLSPLKKLENILTLPGDHSFPDLETVIQMLTINGATLLGQSDRTGSIKEGKYADLVILDKNIFDLPVHEISKTQIQMTMLQGEIVYSSGGFLPVGWGVWLGASVTMILLAI